MSIVRAEPSFTSIVILLTISLLTLNCLTIKPGPIESKFKEFALRSLIPAFKPYKVRFFSKVSDSLPIIFFSVSFDSPATSNLPAATLIVLLALSKLKIFESNWTLPDNAILLSVPVIDLTPDSSLSK